MDDYAIARAYPDRLNNLGIPNKYMTTPARLKHLARQRAQGKMLSPSERGGDRFEYDRGLLDHYSPIHASRHTREDQKMYGTLRTALLKDNPLVVHDLEDFVASVQNKPKVN